MAKKPKKSIPHGRKAGPLSLAPLTMDEAVDAIFKIAPSDVRRIVAKRPGRGQKK